MVDGLGRDVEPRADPAIAEAVRHAAQDLHLPLCQAEEILARRGPGSARNSPRPLAPHPLTQRCCCGKRAPPVEAPERGERRRRAPVRGGRGPLIGAAEPRPGGGRALPFALDLLLEGLCHPPRHGDRLAAMPPPEGELARMPGMAMPDGELM